MNIDDQGVAPASQTPGQRPSGAEPQEASQAKPRVPNARGYIPEDGWRAARRFRCETCLETVAEADVLEAQNPFDPDDPRNVIHGCPHCREPEDLVLLCDFPGCTRIGSAGEPTPEGGYVHRCHEHSLWSFAKRDASAAGAFGRDAQRLDGEATPERPGAIAKGDAQPKSEDDNG